MSVSGAGAGAVVAGVVDVRSVGDVGHPDPVAVLAQAPVELVLAEVTAVGRIRRVVGVAQLVRRHGAVIASDFRFQNIQRLLLPGGERR